MIARRLAGCAVSAALSLAASACGHGSSPTGPDAVPAAERAEHLQSQKDRTQDPPRVVPMGASEIIALPTIPRAYSRGDLAQIAGLEARGVQVRGFVARILPKDDGDYHVQITETAIGRCLGQDTTDQLITELTPGIRARKPAYTLDALRALCGSETEIRVTGWLLYDSPHNGDGGRSTPWEVHPVTRIELCCWRELS